MADNRTLQILITAKDETEKQLKNLKGKLDDLQPTFTKMAAIGTGATAALGFGIKQTVDASNELNNALTGLNSVANAFGQDSEAAKNAAVELANDGLMSVKSAADSLKNLLATGFSLPEAIDLMKGFKDAAAFNRQGTLEFGQSIEGATQGIKNQNSILVDNAGITKNLSIILKEAGYSIQDLGNVTSDAGVRQALYNGILKEASIFQGDAARAVDTLSGKQAELSTQVFTLKAAIGDALAPALLDLIKAITPIVSKVTEWIGENPKLTATIVIFTGAATSLLAVFGLIGLALPGLIATFGALGAVFVFIAANPIVIIIAAFVALGVAVVKLATDWDQTKDSLKFIWETIKEIWGSATEWVKEKIDDLIGFFDNLITKIERAIEALKKYSGYNMVKSAYSNLPANLGLSGARAAGGPVGGGKSYLVGEKGPEIFTPSGSGNIIPNNRIGGGMTVNITINGDVSGREVVERVKNGIMNDLSLNGRLAY